MIDFEAVERAKPVATPFEFFTASNLLRDDDLKSVQSDFPQIDRPGLFPLSSLTFGPGFGALIDDIRSPRMMEVLGRKFGIALSGLPLMITVRGHARRKTDKFTRIRRTSS